MRSRAVTNWLRMTVGLFGLEDKLSLVDAEPGCGGREFRRRLMSFAPPNFSKCVVEKENGTNVSRVTHFPPHCGQCSEESTSKPTACKKKQEKGLNKKETQHEN